MKALFKTDIILSGIISCKKNDNNPVGNTQSIAEWKKKP